jgi:hypothetical protein
MVTSSCHTCLTSAVVTAHMQICCLRMRRWWARCSCLLWHCSLSQGVDSVYCSSQVHGLASLEWRSCIVLVQAGPACCPSLCKAVVQACANGICCMSRHVQVDLASMLSLPAACKPSRWCWAWCSSWCCNIIMSAIGPRQDHIGQKS